MPWLKIVLSLREPIQQVCTGLPSCAGGCARSALMPLLHLLVSAHQGVSFCGHMGGAATDVEMVKCLDWRFRLSAEGSKYESTQPSKWRGGRRVVLLPARGGFAAGEAASTHQSAAQSSRRLIRHNKPLPPPPLPPFVQC